MSQQLKVEQLICQDIARQLMDAEQDKTWGWDAAYLHRLQVARGFVGSLEKRLDEKIEEALNPKR